MQTVHETSEQPVARPKPVILAFLQNPWFKEGTPERYIERYRHDRDFHRRVLYLSRTGQALHRAFGEQLYQHVVWENASPFHGDHRGHVSPADPAHMTAQIEKIMPNVVLLFGREAQAGWKKVYLRPSTTIKMVVLEAPYPMARGSVIDHLKNIAREVRSIYDKE